MNAPGPTASPTPAPGNEQGTTGAAPGDGTTSTSTPAVGSGGTAGGGRGGKGWGALLGIVAGTVAVVAVVVVLLIVVVGLGGAPSNGGPGQGPAEFQTAGTHNYGRAPAYTLVDQNGRRFASSQLSGKVQVVSYLFPYCTSYCPLTAREMKLAEDDLRSQGLMDKVAFVAFNVDPENTGPSQERSFLREFGISPTDPAWHFLTGTPAAVNRVVHDGFHIYYKKVSLASEARTARRQKRAGTYQPQPVEPNPLASKAAVNYDVVHNDSIEIVGASGRILYYTSFGDQVTASQIVAAVRAAAPH